MATRSRRTDPSEELGATTSRALRAGRGRPLTSELDAAGRGGHGETGAGARRLNRDYTIPGVDRRRPTRIAGTPARSATTAARTRSRSSTSSSSSAAPGSSTASTSAFPTTMISMVLGPSGTGKSVLIKHIVGLLYPDAGRRAGARRVGPEHDRRRAVRDAQEVRPALPGRRAVRLDERVRQHRLPAAPAHGQVRGRDRRDLQPAAPRGRARRGRAEDAERALGRDAQARRASPARWCWTRRSSCSTSPTRASTRFARRCSAS